MLSRVEVAPAAKLPPAGTAAVEILACDLSHVDARKAVRMTAGLPVLRELRRRRARWVVVIIGQGGRVVISLETEAELLQVGADATELAPYLDGPVVLLPFGGPGLREKLIGAARRRELEICEMRGAA